MPKSVIKITNGIHIGIIVILEPIKNTIDIASTAMKADLVYMITETKAQKASPIIIHA
jgi:hypothetical protein